MSIRYLTGRAAALKPRLYEELRAALNEGGDEPLIVLVPEQYTLESEREIVTALSLEGSFRLQVMSPARLYSRVFAEAGRPAETRIDERGRVMLMHAALKGLTRELNWYRGAQHRAGFAERAAGQIAELKQAGYTPDRLSALSESLPGGPLRAKLGDLARIWTAYEEALRGRYMDGEDELERALSRLDNAPFLRDARIWANGFELVSPTLARTLTALAGRRDTALLLPLEMDEGAGDYDTFEPVRRSFARLCRKMADAGVEQSTVLLEEPPEKQSELTQLRREINCVSPRVWDAPPRCVRLVSRRNPLDEAMLVMATIRSRVMDGKMRWRDAAIACFDLPAYDDALRRAAALYEVPVFLESGRGSDRNALARFVTLHLRVVSANWQTEDVIALMRTGYTDLTDEEADRLANAAIEQGLRGALWKKPLHRYQDERDEALEPLRLKLAGPVMRFEEEFIEAEDTRAQMTAIWNLLERAGAHDKLRAFEESCAQSGLWEAANENAQVWNRLITTLDQMTALMADTPLAARDVSEMITQSLAASDIKPLPQSGDAVMIGSLNHLRGGGVDTLFIMGCNEMRASSQSGLFQTRERELLGGERGVWLAPDAGDRTRLAAIDLSATLAMARRFAVFTYALSDAEGAAVMPGSVVGRLRAVFPALHDSGGLAEADRTARLMLNAPDAALVQLSGALSSGELSDAERAAFASLSRLETASFEMANLRKAAAARTFSADIDRATAKKLYGGPTSVSVTRLEKYAACPFMHFIQYGLRPEKLEPYALSKADEGTFYHAAMEDFLRDARSGGMSAEEAVERMDAVAERLLAPMMDGPLGDNPVMLAHSRRMRMIARRAARTATRQLSQSGFEPFALEVKFGEYAPAVVLHTSSGDVPVQGRIDRIDRWNDQDETWLRVIDYKSGLSELNLSRLYFGLQLQLIIYLAAALGRGENHPAGAFYFKVADPVVESESRDPEAVEGERVKELRLSGLYINDQAVLKAMSPGVDKIVNLTLKSDGTPQSSASMLDEDGFALLIRYAIEAAARMTDEIAAGKTGIDPKKMSGFCSCDKCDWKNVCQQDPLLGGMPRTLTPAVKQKEVLGLIRDKLDGEAEE